MPADVDDPPLPLSPRMIELCDFIKSFIDREGYSPSMEEAAAALGVSTPYVYRLGLEAVARGGLTRKRRSPRSWLPVDAGGPGPKRRHPRG